MSTGEQLFGSSEAYQVLKQISQGRFGKVTLCRRSRDGHLVAVKTMRLGEIVTARNERRMVRSLSQVDVCDSHIVRFYEVFKDRVHQHLVAELLDRTVAQLQKESGFRPLALRHIRTITCQMLKALRKLREIHVIHADLKPENIMLVDHGRAPFRVKLVDFGSSCFSSEVRSVVGPHLQSRFYRAPEILLGLPFSEQVDMWSLGCVMAELHLGSPLYPGDSEMKQVQYICETQGRPHDNLLNFGCKTHLFFTLTENSRGEFLWQLNREEGAGGSKGRGEDGRKYILSSLDELVSLERTGDDAQQGNEDAAAERMDLCSMVELLKAMLTLDPKQRIGPTAAFCHPFITTVHLSRSPELSRYYQASKLAMQQAGVWDDWLVGGACKATVADDTETAERREGHRRASVSPQLHAQGELANKPSTSDGAAGRGVQSHG